MTDRIVQVLLRQGVLLGQRSGACQVGPRDLECCLAALQARLGGIDLRLEWLLVHLEQHLARLDQRTLDIDPLVEEAGHPCLDVDRLRTLGLRDIGHRDRNIARLNGQGRHLDGRGRRPRPRLPTATDDAREEDNCIEKA